MEGVWRMHSICMRPVGHWELRTDRDFGISLLRETCKEYRGWAQFGCNLLDIGNKSISSGAAMVLSLKDRFLEKIMILGRWKAMHLYITPDLMLDGPIWSLPIWLHSTTSSNCSLSTTRRRNLHSHYRVISTSHLYSLIHVKCGMVVPSLWKQNTIEANICKKLGTKIGTIWAGHQVTNQSRFRCGGGKVTSLWLVYFSQNNLETKKHFLDRYV